MTSPTFSLPHDLRTAADATYVYAGAGTASHWFSALTTRGTVACQVRYFRTALTALGRADGVTVGPIRSGRLELPVGDQHAATRITIQLFDFGATVHAAVDLVYVRVGRALAAFALVGIESPFDPTLERTLVKTVTDRLAADLRASS